MADWLEGKDSMIDRLRVLRIMATATWVETTDHHLDRPRLYGLRPSDGHHHFLSYLEGSTVVYLVKQSNKMGWKLA